MKAFKEFISENEDNTFYHVTPSENVKSIMKTGLRPSVGDRSKKLNEKPSTFLFKNKDDAEDAMMNWMGDELENTPTNLLKIKLPPHIKAHKSSAGYEHQVFGHIHPKHIEDLGDF